MRERLKNNTKIKLIALLSSIVLWMYVMAVVDPDETKVFEDVPVTITNIEELKDKDLIIYPEEDITTNVYVTGRLSDIQKISKEDINVYGQVSKPIEGKNDIYLRVTPSSRVTYEFKNPVAIVNLEKIIENSKNIEIQIEGNSKDKIDTVELENDKNELLISGPRSLVDQVSSIRTVLNTDNRVEDYNTTLKLTPVDKKGNIIKGVDLEIKSIKAKVILLKEKTVPINIQFTGENDPNVNLKDYKLSQNTVYIKGKKSDIDKIEYINTKPVNLSEIPQSTSQEISLEIPEGITSDVKYITMKLNNISKITNQFTYTSDEVKMNNSEDVDLSKLKLPETITVTVEYNSDIGTVAKEGISLYIDLAQENVTDGKYEIKYESSYNLNSIDINPKTTE
ncbi:MAG: CdaR family protein [Peptostreptococcaceae bacterium]